MKKNLAACIAYCKNVLCATGYLLYLTIFIFAIDLIYMKFFERIPPLKTDVYLQITLVSIHRHSKIEGLFYELKPNSEAGFFKINSFGMRDKEPRTIKDCYRVLVMGDSVTFGPEVSQDELFTEVAEKILNVGGNKVEILNAGVSCYNTKQEFIALREKYLCLSPDLIIFAYCSNDSVEAAIQFMPSEYVQNKILKSGEKIDDKFYINLPKVYYLALTLPNQFFLTYTLDRWLMLNSGIYRTMSLLKFKNKHKIRDLRELPNFLFSFDLNKVLQDIKTISKDNNFSVVFMILPTGSRWDKDYVMQSLTRNGISVWDFDAVVKEKYDRYRNFFTDPRTMHLNPEGHFIVGTLLAEEINKLIR